MDRNGTLKVENYCLMCRFCYYALVRAAAITFGSRSKWRFGKPNNDH